MSCCLYSTGWPGSMSIGPTAAESASWGGAIFHKRLHLLKMCVAASHRGCSQVEHGNSLHGRGLQVMCHLDTAPGLRRNLASSTLCLGTQPPSASFCSCRKSTPGRRTAQRVKGLLCKPDTGVWIPGTHAKAKVGAGLQHWRLLVSQSS